MFEKVPSLFAMVLLAAPASASTPTYSATEPTITARIEQAKIVVDEALRSSGTSGSAGTSEEPVRVAWNNWRNGYWNNWNNWRNWNNFRNNWNNWKNWNNWNNWKNWNNAAFIQQQRATQQLYAQQQAARRVEAQQRQLAAIRQQQEARRAQAEAQARAAREASTKRQADAAAAIARKQAEAASIRAKQEAAKKSLEQEAAKRRAAVEEAKAKQFREIAARQLAIKNAQQERAAAEIAKSRKSGLAPMGAGINDAIYCKTHNCSATAPRPGAPAKTTPPGQAMKPAVLALNCREGNSVRFTYPNTKDCFDFSKSGIYLDQTSGRLLRWNPGMTTSWEEYYRDPMTYADQKGVPAAAGTGAPLGASNHPNAGQSATSASSPPAPKAHFASPTENVVQCEPVRKDGQPCLNVTTEPAPRYTCQDDNSGTMYRFSNSCQHTIIVHLQSKKYGTGKGALIMSGGTRDSASSCPEKPIESMSIEVPSYEKNVRCK